MEFTNEQITRAMESLPEEFQDAIADSYVSNKVLEIGQQHALHIDQIGKLQDNAMFAALGLIDGNTFGKTIAKELAIPSDKALAIVRDVNSEVFEGIRALVKERTVREETETREENAEATPASPPEPARMSESEVSIDREAILKEIESPVPAILPSMAQKSASVPPPSPAISSATPSPETPLPAAVPLAAPESPAKAEVSAAPQAYKVFNAPSDQSPPPGVPPHLPPNLPTGTPSFAPPTAASVPEATVVGQKLSAPTATPNAETVHKEGVISFAKKIDPYREPIG